MLDRRDLANTLARTHACQTDQAPDSHLHAMYAKP